MSDRTEVGQFRELFNDNYSSLLRYAARRAPTYEDAKDVVADVFTIAWRRRDSLPGDSTEQRMWLYGVARRVLGNRHRSDIRLTRLRERLKGVALEVVPDHGADDDSSDIEAAARALNALRPHDREILLLSLWEELTPTQIGSVMDMTAPRVSVRLHRAKARLRKEFLRQVKEPDEAGHVVDRRAHGEVAPETTS